MKRRKTWAIVLAAAFVAQAGRASGVADPFVEGPVPYSVGVWGFPWASVPDPAELTDSGYTEAEFFFAGTVPTAIGSQPYKSRMIVRRPSDPARFNGTVAVEWLNVTVGADLGVDWALTRRQIVRDGYAYVGVTAQPLGVCWLKLWDSVRYATLTHPALLPGPCPVRDDIETYSFDIFSQAGRAVRNDPAILGGLAATRLVAVGASQSAKRLRDYVNTYQAAAGIYDGFLIHVLTAGGLIANTDARVLILNSENEVLINYPLRGLQPANVRYWEVAGAGHTPETTYIAQQSQRGGITPGFNCNYPPSDDVIPMYPVGDAALDAMNRWISEGTSPPGSPLVTVLPGTPNVIARDEYGNALGGIRLPQIEVPIGRFVGTNTPTTALLCRSSGGFDSFDGQPAGTTPNDAWDEPTIDVLYPNHGSYVFAFVQAVDDLVRAGFMLAADAEIAKAEAARSQNGK